MPNKPLIARLLAMAAKAPNLSIKWIPGLILAIEEKYESLIKGLTDWADY
jgi:hypothetical protein